MWMSKCRHAAYWSRSSMSIALRSFDGRSRLERRPPNAITNSHRFQSTLMSSLMDKTTEIFMAVSQSTPVIHAQELLVNIHDVTGLEWWAIVVGSAVFIRTTVTFPLAAYQARVLGRYAALKPEIDALAEELAMETSVAVKRFGWSKATAKRAYKISLRKVIRKLIIRDNCHPFKASIVVFVQIPAWLCLSFSLRNLVYMMPDVQDFGARMVFMAMSGEGALWFPNLTMPDSTFILPIILGVSNLLITEIHASKFSSGSRFQKTLTYLLYGVSVIMVPMAATVPSSMALYWATSSCMGLFQNLLLMSPAFRQLVGIPKTTIDKMSDHPYRDIIVHFKKKFLLLK